MKPLYKRLLISLASIIIAIILIALGIFIYFITPAGLQTLTKLSHQYYGQVVQIDQASGSLSSTVSVKKLKLTLGSKQIDLNNLSVSIQPWHLWFMHVLVNQVAATAITIHTLQTSTSNNSTSTSTAQSPSETLKQLPSAFAFPSWLTVNAVELHKIKMIDGQSTQLSLPTIHGQLTSVDNQAVFTLQGQSKLPISMRFQAIAKGSRDAYTVKLSSNDKPYIINGKLKVTPKQLILTPFTIKKGSAYANLTVDYLLGDTPQLTLNGQFKQFPIYAQTLSGSIKASIQPTTGTDIAINMTGKKVKNTQQDRIKLNLKHQHYWSGEWQTTIHQLKTWAPFMKGSLNSQGHFKSRLWRTTGKVSIVNLHYQSNQLHQLQGNWAIDDTNTKVKNNIQLNFKSLLLSGYLIKHGSLSTSGTLSQHSIQLSMADSYNQTLATTLQGTFDLQNLTWSGKIKQTSFAQTKTKQWQQAQPSNLTVNKNGLTLSAFKLKQGSHYLSLSGNYILNNPWSLSTAGKLSGNWPFIQEPVLRAASITWTGTLKGEGNQLQSFNTQTHFATKLPPLTARAPKKLPVSATVKASWKNNKLNSQISAKVASHGVLNSDVTLKQLNLNNPASFKSATIKATTNGQMNTALLQNLLAHITANVTSKGPIDLSSTITGTVAAPQIELNADHTGTMNIPLLGSTVSNILLKVNSNQATITPKLTMTYNKKPLTLYGKINIPQSLGNDTSNKAWISTWKFNNPTFTASNTEKHKVDITPNLSMHCSNLKCHLKGKVSIPKASLTISAQTSSNTLPTNEIQYTTSDSSGNAAEQFTYRVLVSLGKSVQINAYGFKGGAHGDITLIKENQTPLLLSGKVSFTKATYTFQSNVLPITTAEISYTKSPPSNPSVQITAQRTVKVYAMPNTTQQNGQLRVGMHVSGFLTNPNIQLYSYPNALSKQDILSYLILGQASSTGGMLSTAAVFALNKSSSSKSPNIMGNMKKMFGLTEFGVENTNTYDNSGNVVSQQDQFVVGKKLFNKMYLRYTLGLGDADTLLMLIYQLTKHVSIQSTQGVQSSRHIGSAIDLMYQLSRP